MLEAEKTYEHVLVETDGPVAYVTMNRPGKRNALSLDHMLELIDCFASIGEARDASVVVLRGEGPAFCAGHDLSEMIGRDPDFYRGIFDTCCRLMETIQGIPQPVIAQVHSVATAAGCQLAATCDLVVASQEARFATPGVRIGLFCSTPMVPISRAVGRKRAMEMLLTGEPISAATALDWGLVNRVVPAERLDEAVDELVAAVTRYSSAVIGIGKAAFYRQIDLPEPDAYDLTRAVMTRNAAMADAQEGIDAFLGKRTPQWPAPLG